MPLTPEIIETTWSNGGTVQIATPADLNIFNAYLQSNYSASDMRYAEITADLDFKDGEISFTPMYPPSGSAIMNLTLDGNNHTIKGIVEDAFSASGIFFWGNIDTTILQNIIISKCNIAHLGNGYCQPLTANTIRNVKLDHCRFSTSSQGYRGLEARIIEDYSSAATIYCNNGGSYIGVYISYTSKRIAMLDTVHRSEMGGTATALYYANGVSSLAFTRNRYYNWGTAIGIHKHYSNANVSTTYAAITAENATEIYPLGGDGYFSDCPNASYYDNILVPNSVKYTDRGLTTSELQSVASMTAKGFAVEEA